MHQRFTLSDVPEATSRQSTPVALLPQWARSTGILGALGCWALATPPSESARECPGAPGPVYGRLGPSGGDTLSFDELRTHFASGHIIHVSSESGDPVGLLLPHHLGDVAVDVGSVLVHKRADSTSAWIPSIDSALHRPTVVLTQTHLGQPDMRTWHDPWATAFTERLSSGLPTVRAGYRSALLETLNAVEALGVRIFDTQEPHDVRLPQLPRSVTPERMSEIKGVLSTLALLHRIRCSGDSTSAGSARREQLAALAAVTADLHRAARLYLDALWSAAMHDTAQMARLSRE